jgi:2-oxoglutarate ferredoxin oxidoreductase subunit delta
MSRIVIDEERCKGCLLCTLLCPKEIIRQSGRFNAQGYKVAEVTPEDAAECTGCTSCALICPDMAITVWRSVKPAAKEKEETADVE